MWLLKMDKNMFYFDASQLEYRTGIREILLDIGDYATPLEAHLGRALTPPQLVEYTRLLLHAAIGVCSTDTVDMGWDELIVEFMHKAGIVDCKDGWIEEALHGIVWQAEYDSGRWLPAEVVRLLHGRVIEIVAVGQGSYTMRLIAGTHISEVRRLEALQRNEHLLHTTQHVVMCLSNPDIDVGLIESCIDTLRSALRRQQE